MKQKKLVCESLDQFIDENPLDEGWSDKIKDFGSKIKNISKATFKKVGEYYVLPLVPSSMKAKTNLTYD